MDRKGLGYIVKQHFYNEDSKCSHVLAQTNGGYLIIIEVEPFDHTGGVLVSTLKTSTTPQNLAIECLEFFKGSKIKICFLTHIGLDLQHIYGYSLYFKNPKSDVPKLQLGTKFAMPLVYIKSGELKGFIEGKSLRNLVEESENLTVFNALLSRSTVAPMLEASGPYMLFAPDNAMLEDAYGPGANTLKTKTKALDSVICSYIVPGDYDRDFSGNVTSVTGQELKIVTGIPQIPGQKTKMIEPTLFARNGKMTVISSTGVLTPAKSGLPVLFRNLTIQVSRYDIEKAASQLMDFQISFAAKLRAEMRSNMKAILSKLKELDQLDEDARNVGQDSDLVTFHLEHAKRAAKMASLHIPSNELTKNVIDL